MKTLLTIFTAIALLAQMPVISHSQTSDFVPESFSVFSLPQNLGLPVNTVNNENSAVVAPNGLSLYVSSNATGTLGSTDLWVSQRTSLTAAWGVLQNLGATLNTTGVDNLPAISADGKTMFFNSSGRPDTLGGADIYMTTRTDPNNDFGWTTPVGVGAVVNSTANEIAAGYFENPANGTAILYFTSDRAGGLGGEDIWQSTRNANGTFNPPTNFTALNSISNERRALLRHDGLEAFFDSDRGGLGGRDIYVSTRSSVSAPWNPPVNLADVNSSGTDQHPTVSPNGSVLYFVSNRDGTLDIYSAVRTSVNRTPTGDFDGDGRTDQAVYRNGEWHLNRSSQGYTVVNFGLATDKPVIGDYDGDGKTDQAVYRNGIWYILGSTQGYTVLQFGLATDIPAPADYDGDGRMDVAVYRNGVWYLGQSTSGVSIQQFGLTNDKPVPSVYLP